MEKTPLTIVSKREWEITTSKGEQKNGVTYIAFNAENEPIKFQSQNYDHKVYTGTMKFDPKKSELITLQIDLFDGVMKFREMDENSDIE
jgi:hypothetical protein